MALKRVPLFLLVLLGAAAAFPGAAIAEEEDSRCQVQMCYTGLNAENRCRTTHEAYESCDERCTDQLGCDGGTQVGDSFSCGPTSTQPFFLCQCNYCGGSGGDPGDGGGGSGPGDGGGGIGCSDCLCSDEVCDDNCWWDGWDWGECYLGECWCHASMND